MIADADQTASDADQVSSDTDQTASDRDRAGADFDQHASDQDQATADKDRKHQGDLSPADQRAYEGFERAVVLSLDDRVSGPIKGAVPDFDDRG
jgi:hypothetical protein